MIRTSCQLLNWEGARRDPQRPKATAGSRAPSSPRTAWRRRAGSIPLAPTHVSRNPAATPRSHRTKIHPPRRGFGKRAHGDARRQQPPTCTFPAKPNFLERFLGRGRQEGHLHVCFPSRFYLPPRGKKKKKGKIAYGGRICPFESKRRALRTERTPALSHSLKVTD